MPGGFRQTRPGQPAAEKYGTISAGLIREYGLHLEKTRKYLPAVVCLQAGRCSKPSFRPTRKRRAVPLPHESTLSRRWHRCSPPGRADDWPQGRQPNGSYLLNALIDAHKSIRHSLICNAVSLYYRAMRFNLELLKYSNKEVELFCKNL